MKRRYSDLNPVKRFGLRALLAGNPGLRLRAAQERAAKHLQEIDAQGRRVAGGLQSQLQGESSLPSAITGYAGAGSDGFRLEPDGVWPTSKRRKSRRGAGSLPPTIMEEEYVPQHYLEAYNCIPPPIFIPLIVLVQVRRLIFAANYPLFFQVAVFIYYAVELNNRAAAEPENALTWSTGFPYFSPLYYDPRRRREAWRFFTYMFVHQVCICIYVKDAFIAFCWY